MAHVALLQKQSLLVCALVLHFSLGACCAKKPCEDRLHTSETLFRAPQWFCTFQKGPRYYSAGDFKHFPNSFWFSLMHSHAQHSLSSRSTGCVSIIKGLLTHMITGMAHWHMPSPPGNQTLIPPHPHPHPLCVFFPSIILWLELVIQCFFGDPHPVMCLQPGSLPVVMAAEFCCLVVDLTCDY